MGWARAVFISRAQARREPVVSRGLSPVGGGLATVLQNQAMIASSAREGRVAFTRQRSRKISRGLQRSSSMDYMNLRVSDSGVKRGFARRLAASRTEMQRAGLPGQGWSTGRYARPKPQWKPPKNDSSPSNPSSPSPLSRWRGLADMGGIAEPCFQCVEQGGAVGQNLRL